MKLETKNLFIRPPHINDFDDYWKMNNDPIAKKYTGGVIDLTYDEALEIHEKVCREFIDNPNKVFSVIEKSSEKCVGYCGLKYCDKLNGIEICYGYSQSSWGQGYGYESAYEVFKYGFQVMGLKKVVAAVNPKNIASEKILKKLGMIYVGKIDWSNQGKVNSYELTSEAYCQRR